jgi:hypothetical protein
VQIANSPAGDADEYATAKPAPVASRPAPAVSQSAPPAATAPIAPAAGAAKPSVDDILKMIRNRQA